MSEGQDNPFYDNHLFSKKDLERAAFSRWNWLWLWMHPTYVQITDGYVWKYKLVNGAYWFIGYEELNTDATNPIQFNFAGATHEVTETQIVQAGKRICSEIISKAKQEGIGE